MIIEYDRVIVEFATTIDQQDCWPYTKDDQLFLVRQTTTDEPKALWHIVRDVSRPSFAYSMLCSERAVQAERGDLRIGPKRPLQIKAEDYLSLWRQVTPMPLSDLRKLGLELCVSVNLHCDTVEQKLSSPYWEAQHERIRRMLNSPALYPLEQDRMLWVLRLGSLATLGDAACLRQMVDAKMGDRFEHNVIEAIHVEAHSQKSVKQVELAL